MNRKLKILTVLVAGTVLLGLSGVAAHAGGKVDIPFNPGNFSDPLNIDNQYSPLPAGTTFWYYSVSKDGCEVNPVEVTYGIEPIAGVTTRVVHDQVFEDENCDGVIDSLPGGDPYLSEDTLDYYGQDNDGNVWYFGEDTESYEYDEDGNLIDTSTEGSWRAGVEDAVPGIVMLADPTPGTYYRQEYQEDVAEDMAKVLRLNARVELTFDNEIDPDKYKGCLITNEWSPLERGAIEHKYYCPEGGGLVLINELQGGTVRTELISIE